MQQRRAGCGFGREADRYAPHTQNVLQVLAAYFLLLLKSLQRFLRYDAFIFIDGQHLIGFHRFQLRLFARWPANRQIGAALLARPSTTGNSLCDKYDEPLRTVRCTNLTFD